MKICMIVPQENVKGGIASVVAGYREQGFPEGIKMTYIESYRDGNRGQKLIKALKGYWSFCRVLWGDKPDLVHIHSSFGPSFYRKLPFIYLASFRQIPVINHIHGADFDSFYVQAGKNKKKLIRRVYGKCRMLIALSMEWKERLSKIVPPEKIAVLENYCKIPEKIERGKEAQILFLGEIGRRKGCLDIPEILAYVQEKVSNLPPVVMAGEGDVEEVKSRLLERGLLDVVSFPGWLRGAEKEKVLRESSIFLFPSYHEGMPMALLEAMAYNMAIVTTAVGGIPVLVEDDVSGYLCEPGNIRQLGEALRRLLEDEEKSRHMGQAAGERARKRYSLSIHMEKLMELYRQAFN